MEKIRIAVVGFGNVGQKVVEAVLESPDMDLVGIVELEHMVQKAKRLSGGIPVVADIKDLGEVDVAILAINSRAIPEKASGYLEASINTVDAFDIHGDEMMALKEHLDKVAKDHDAVSVISAGWDPGTDSVIRALFEMIAPTGVTTVNFGPGMSMGHTVAVKSIPGVNDAISITVPKGMGVHKRMVYVEVKRGYDFEEVTKQIKEDPYFKNDETHVFPVDDVKSLIDMGHGVLIERKGVSGKTHNQKMAFTMSIDNPAATAQVMVSAARACMKQAPGCYTLLEIPPIDFLHGEKKDIIKRLV